MLTFLLALGVAGTLSAQTPGSNDLGPMTRAEIRTRAEAAERQAATAGNGQARAQWAAEAASLRARLRDGDFHAGDRLALEIRGDTSVRDTLPVRDDRSVSIPNLLDVSLQGVLYSELDSSLTVQVGRYLRNARVHATPLMRLQIGGQVGKPGFYYLPADALLSDAVMAAGGPGQGADLSRTVVRRDAREVISRDQTREAIRTGETISRLGLLPGDEIVVGQESQHNWQAILSLVSVAATASLALITLLRR